jgi:hypothetical protein
MHWAPGSRMQRDHAARCMPRQGRGAMCATCACAGRWKRPGSAIASRARHLTAKADHFAHQPFGQISWLTDGDLSIFESGRDPASSGRA